MKSTLIAPVIVGCLLLSSCGDHAQIAEGCNTPGAVHGQLTKDRFFEQSFTAKAGYIDKIRLLLATYARQNTGPFNMSIIDENGQVIATQEMQTENLKDNDWIEIDFTSFWPFNKVKVDVGHEYKIRLTSYSGTDTNSITWWASPKDTCEIGKAFVNGQPIDSDFVFEVTFH